MYQNFCECNPIEGCNGNARHRFDLIFFKLDETEKDETSFSLSNSPFFSRLYL